MLKSKNTKIREHTFNHIESEIFDYLQTIKQIDLLECRISGGLRNTPVNNPVVPQVRLQKRYDHLNEVINSIDQFLSCQSRKKR
jgi:hypothetical protein